MNSLTLNDFLIFIHKNLDRTFDRKTINRKKLIGCRFSYLYLKSFKITIKMILL